MKCCIHCQDYRYCDDNIGSCCKYCSYHKEDKCYYKNAKEITAKLG